MQLDRFCRHTVRETLQIGIDHFVDERFEAAFQSPAQLFLGLGRIGKLNPLQQSFHEHHALQCGFCTPGMLMTATDLLKKYPLATDDDIRDGLSGNLCRCTGYEHIVKAIRAVKAGAAR